MKKVIKLTESDLREIVEKVLNEQASMFGTAGTEIAGYRRDDSRQPNRGITTKPNINPKGLKMGDGGKADPAKAAEVKKLQQKLMDLKFLRTDSMVPTGYFGKLTQNALDAYNAGSTVVTAKGVTTGGKTAVDAKKTGTQKVNSGFILVFSFPDYQPSVEDTWFNRNIMKPLSTVIANEDENIEEQIQSGSGGSNKKTGMIKLDKVGHGGCVIVYADGNAKLYEFGRYASNDKGNVISKNLGRIAKIQNGKLLNAKEVASAAKRKTEGDGPRLAMDVVVRELPNPAAATTFANVKERDYATADPARGGAMNCGTYSLEVAIEGGVDTSFSCFASPVGVVKHLKPGLESFTV